MASSGRKPDLLCIGAQKAGTSWLHETLGQHPDVWVPPFKEVHFFDHKFIDECRRWAGWHVRRGVKQARERHLGGPAPDPEFLTYLDRIVAPPMFNGTWYQHVFSRAWEGARCLDVTPEYSCLPEEGIDFVARFLPSARFIYIVRSPLARALSQLKMNAMRRDTPPSCAADWMALAQSEVIFMRGDYASYVPQWRSRFPEERLLFIPYGDIERDPISVLRAVETHAGLPHHTGYRDLDRRVHASPALDVPFVVVDMLRARLRRQGEFLEAEFGRDFAIRCGEVP